MYEQFSIAKQAKHNTEHNSIKHFKVSILFVCTQYVMC